MSYDEMGEGGAMTADELGIPSIEEVKDTYEELVETLIRQQLTLSAKGDRVAALFVKDMNPQLQVALQNIPSWENKRERLQEIYLEVVEEIERPLAPEQRRGPDGDFTSMETEKVRGFLNGILENLQINPSPEGWPDLQILSVSQVAALARRGAIQSFLEKNRVVEFLAQNHVPQEYLNTIREDMLEQAILSAYMVKAMNNAEKFAIATPGALFNPSKLR